MIRYYSVPKETFVTNGTIVEPLNVTENGTYAPPAGTAYSPVTVNVEGGGGGSSDILVVLTIEEGTLDKTWKEIHDAIEEEKICIIIGGGYMAFKVSSTGGNGQAGFYVEVYLNDFGETSRDYYCANEDDYPILD